MKHQLILLLVFIACTSIATAQIPKPVEQALAAENIAEGTEFFIAIPPNEVLPFSTNALEVYITSAFDTEVEVYDYTVDKTTKYQVKKNEIRTLSDGNGSTSWTWELRVPEEVVKGGIRIRSGKPISVFVLNSKTTTSDGYMAIPTSSWDRNYIHVGYYDFKEARAWAGGFVIVAKDEGTVVNVELKGTGAALAKTAAGKSINTGSIINLTMNAGDVYMVKGDGTTRGVFDLTGTKISSNKPIGVISFHERTTMPNILVEGNGRNHLVEMLTPISAWGRNFASIEIPRESVNNQGKGDVFRLVASDSNTTWTLKYYEETTGQLIGQAGGTLIKAGDFADIGNVSAPAQITNGFSVWETSKPAYLMQYSCSSTFDGDLVLDPFMIAVAPLESSSRSLAFSAAAGSKFSKHIVSTIIKILPGVQDTLTALKSLMLDSVSVATHPNASSPKLLATKMPNGLYWARVSFNTNKRHTMTSNDSLLLGGYVHGYGQFDAYGWSIGGMSTPPVTLDTMPPLIVQLEDTCGTWTLEATELRNIPDPPLAITKDTNQVETGIAMIDTVSGASSKNFRLTLMTSPSFPVDPSVKRFQFRWSVVDMLKSARVEYFVRDFNGNTTYDTIIYAAPVFVDTMPPVTSLVAKDGAQWSFNATELRNVPRFPVSCPVSGQQRESGLSAIRLLDGASNLSLSITSGTQFPLDLLITRATFSVRVIDTSMSALGIVSTIDRSGNTILDTLRYDSPTSVNGDISNSIPVSIVPNPASEHCLVSWSDHLHARLVEVLDLHGRVVITHQIEGVENEVLFDVSPLPKGSYTVRLSGSDGSATQRFIVR